MIQLYTKPRHTTSTCQSIEDLEENLALLFAKDNSTLLSLTFNYEKDQRLCLDILTGHLYERNSVSLVPLEALQKFDLIGKEKLIEEILIEF
jgi:hypothetical protein